MAMVNAKKMTALLNELVRILGRQPTLKELNNAMRGQLPKTTSTLVIGNE